MRVAAVQTKPVFGDVKGNVDRALDLAASRDADLYVLTELFATGYLFTSREELASLVEPLDGPVVGRLREFSKEKGCTLVAGLAESEGSGIYNSGVIVVSGELISKYRKLHLFKKEKDLFDRSENPFVVKEVEGVRLGLMICFDWVFPEAARSLALQGAQILCHPSNLVLPYCQRAMITRSIENGVFTVLTNRVGTEDRGGVRLTFTGGSEIVGPRGEVLAQASENGEEIIIAEIEPTTADDKWITPENHLFDDRRAGFYTL